jgi:hypothetical protein
MDPTEDRHHEQYTERCLSQHHHSKEKMHIPT